MATAEDNIWADPQPSTIPKLCAQHQLAHEQVTATATKVVAIMVTFQDNFTSSKKESNITTHYVG